MDESLILKILETIGMDYLLNGGKNASSKVVAVCCPFCGDGNYHAGFFKTSGSYSCFKCNTKGNMYSIISSLIGAEETKNIFIEFGIFQRSYGNQSLSESLSKLHSKFLSDSRIKKEVLKAESENLVEKILPEGLVSVDSSEDVKKFLIEERNIIKPYFGRFLNIYNPLIDTDKTVSYGTYSDLDLKGRIYFPITFKGVVRAWSARDITNKAKKRYLAPKLTFHKDIIAPTSLLHPYDFAMNVKSNRKVLLIQEGVFDTININLCAPETGMYSVCLFTNSISNNQASLLKILSSKYDKIVLMLDRTEELHVPLWALQLLNKGVEKVSYICQQEYKDTGCVPANKMMSYIEMLYAKIENTKEL